MTSTLSTFTEFVMVDTRQSRGAVWLPIASSNQGRRITIKDAYGTFGNSTCQIAASNDDLFDDNTSFKFVSTNYASLSFIAVGSKWYGLSSNVFNQGTNFSSLTINCNSSVYQMDVNGVANFSTLTLRTSTIDSLFASTTRGLGTAGYISTVPSTSNLNAFTISTGTLFASTMSFVNIVPSTMNLWVAGYSNSGTPANNMITSIDGINWSNSNISGTFTSAANDFAFNGRMWVGVGIDTTSTNRIKYSYDGFTWSNSVGGNTFQYSLGTGGGYGIAWNGRYWLALGDSFGSSTSNNSIKYSYDGITFSNVTSGGFTSRGVKAAWNGFMWVAAGNVGGSNGALKYSYNGLNWSNAVSRFTTANPGAGDVAWNGKMWVAVGSASGNDCINYSYDGITWQQSKGASFSAAGTGVAWSGKIWVAVGYFSPNTILYSYDGINWSLGSNYLFNSSGSKVTWNGEFFIAVGSDSFGPQYGTQRISYDGITWNSVGSFWGTYFSGVGYSSNSPPSYRQKGFEILSQNIPYSYFSVNQLLVQNSSLTFNNTLVIDKLGVVGINCNIPQYSLDVNGSVNVSTLNLQGTPVQNVIGSTVQGLGQTYISTAPSTSNLNAFTISTGTLFASTMSYVNINTSTQALLVATGGGVPASNIKYSLDGSNWSNGTGGFAGGGTAVAWNGRMWVAVGSGGTVTTSNIKYSFDGINWSNSATGGFSNQGNDVAWNGRMWVAVGDGGTSAAHIQYSTDGSNWNNSVSGSFTGLSSSANGVAWNGQFWVVVGYGPAIVTNDSIKYSFDGSNWTNSVSGGFQWTGISVAWNGRIWVAGGTAGGSRSNLQYSYDGSNWINSPDPGSINQRLAWNGRMWLALTNFGGSPSEIIKYSYDGINWSNTSASAFAYEGFSAVWTGRLWVAVGYGNSSNESIKYSADGITWSNSVLNGFTGTNRGRGIAFSSNVIPAYAQSNLAILSQNIPIFLTSTNSIMAQPSSLIINDSLIIDRQWDRVGINCNIPQYSLDVNGTVNVSTLNLQGTPVQNVIGSTVAGLGQTYLSAAATQANLTALTISTGNLFASSMSYVNINPSTANLYLTTHYSGTSTATIKYSYDAINWSNITRGGFSQEGRGMAWNGRMWVATGVHGFSNGTIQWSMDGLTWSTVNNGFVSGAYDVAWGQNKWIAVGEAGGTSANAIKYSSDGINWTNSAGVGFTQRGYAVAFNGRMWVAVGTENVGIPNNSIKYSYDGITWISSISGGFSNYNALGIAWGQDKWVAVGEDASPGGTIKYSYDGMNWINTPSPGFSIVGCDVRFNGNVWIAVGQENSATSTNCIQYSYDGISWIPVRSTSNLREVYGVNWGNNVWVAVGYNGVGNPPFYSVDGQNWIAATSPSVVQGGKVAYSSNVISAYSQCNLNILPQNNQTNLFSTNTILNQPSSIVINNTLRVDNQWLRVGVGCNIPLNTLDVNGSANFSTIRNVNINAGSSNLWIAVGQDSTQNNTIKYSINGISWSNSLGNGFTAAGHGIAWNGRMWVAVGEDATQNNRIKYSYNGLNWFNSLGTGFTTLGRNVAWNGRMWVAVGADATQNNTIKYSFNGITWSNSSGTAFNSQGFDVAWNGRLWVAVGYHTSVPANNIQYSSNGINWTAASGATFSVYGYGIAWNGRLWVAVGQDATQNNTIKYSADGITWSNSAGSGFTTMGIAVAWNGRLWVAAGVDSTANNRLKYSLDGIIWLNSQGASFSSSGNGVSWNGSLWVATGQDSTQNNTIKYSVDGITWSNSSGTGFTTNGYRNAFSSNTTPSYSQLNLSILPQNIPTFLTSTNTLFAQPSSLVINDTLVIDGQWDRVGINSNIPQFSLDVNGPARTMMPISSLCNTTASVDLAGHGIFYYITNSGFNGLTLPTVDPIGGWFVSLRNNTGTTLSVTISGTNSKIPASPFSISPANTVTLAYDSAPPSGGCNWVYF